MDIQLPELPSLPPGVVPAVVLCAIVLIAYPVYRFARPISWQRPLDDFLEHYRPFAVPADQDGAGGVGPRGDLHGIGPLLAAGVLTRERWHELGNVLRHDPGSIVPFSEDFAGELRQHVS